MKTILSGIMTLALAYSSGLLTVQAADTGADPAKAGVPDISLADLKQAIGDKAVTLLDCNVSESYAKGHIPGAINFETAKTALADKLPKEKSALVVAYCGGPMCNAYKAGAEAATKLGYTNVKHFAGGIKGWKEAKEKVETADLCPKCGQPKGSDDCCKAK